MGTDIEKSYFPTDPPKNTTYHVQDVNKPWPTEWKEHFDLVHQRLGLVAAGDEQATLSAVRNLVELVKPGGWIQIVEFHDWTADDDSQAWKDYTTSLCDMCKAIGSTVDHANRVKGWFGELGLVDIDEDVATANYGSRDDKEFETIAKRSALTTAKSVLGVVASKCTIVDLCYI